MVQRIVRSIMLILMSFTFSFLVCYQLFLNFYGGHVDGFDASAVLSKPRTDTKNICDREITKYRPAWAPKTGWDIECYDSITIPEKTGTTDAWGITYPNKHLIVISRQVSREMLLPTIVHEWTHATAFVNHYESSPAWDEWNKIASVSGSTGNTYYDLPSEKLARAVAYCTFAPSWNAKNEDISCWQVKQVWPVLTIKEKNPL